ncbi:hypothetical protein [Nocardioides sp. CFH 31398]|nr:hypothetical protein [Nocardioides sp. CFH 31398]MCH1867009.1 hypothetical protein [Nocardioides sp. CFH 31398]
MDEPLAFDLELRQELLMLIEVERRHLTTATITVRSLTACNLGSSAS